MAFGHGVLPCKGCGTQGHMGDPVDIARHAATGRGQGFDGCGFEQGNGGTGQAQAVLEIRPDMFGFQAGEMTAHDDTLVEGLMNAHAQALAQGGRPTSNMQSRFSLSMA